MQLLALGKHIGMQVPNWERDFNGDSVDKLPGIVGKGDGNGGDGMEEEKDEDDIPVPQIETCLITTVTPPDTARSTHRVPWLVFSLLTQTDKTNTIIVQPDCNHHKLQKKKVDDMRRLMKDMAYKDGEKKSLLKVLI